MKILPTLRRKRPGPSEPPSSAGRPKEYTRYRIRKIGVPARYWGVYASDGRRWVYSTYLEAQTRVALGTLPDDTGVSADIRLVIDSNARIGHPMNYSTVRA